jgi:hypothetical protein
VDVAVGLSHPCQRCGLPPRESVEHYCLEAKDKISDNAGRGGIDQVIFVQPCGPNRHEHICESLGIFAQELHAEFKTRWPSLPPPSCARHPIGWPHDWRSHECSGRC